MQRILIATLCLLPLAVGTACAEEFDAAAYHQQHCTGCHDSSVYTRPDHRVDSRTRLESQVRMCDANLGKKLFDDDIQALVDYLNEHYYHFSR